LGIFGVLTCSPQAFLAMAEFLSSPLAAVVFLVALTATLVAVGVYVIGRVRSEMHRVEPGVSEWMTKFRDLHAKGELSDEEFRTIKALLSDRLQHELSDTDKST
jgi:uncharacterized membrane protein